MTTATPTLPASAPDVARAVSRYLGARSRVEQLEATPLSVCSGVTFLALGDAQARMASSRAFLVRVGMAHLIEVAS
jgi:hypothetical protein